MSTPTTGDLLLVNRNGVNYQIDYDDMSTLEDTDLLLVNRGGTNYQLAAADLNLGPEGIIGAPVEVLTPPDGAGVGGDLTYYPKTDIASSATTVLLAGQTTIPGAVNFSDVAYGGGKFVAVCSVSTTGSYVYHSTDGINWTAATSPLNVTWRGVAFGNGTFVAVGDNGGGFNVMTSTDGDTWTGVNTSTAFDLRSVAYDESLARFIAVGYNPSSGVNTAISDDDGATWTDRNTASSSYYFNGVASNGNALAVAVGNQNTPFLYSTNGGAQWVSSNYNGDSQTWNSVRYFPGEGYFVAVGNDGYIATSSDGINWSSNPKVNNAYDYQDVASDGTTTIAIASNGITVVSEGLSTNSWNGGIGTDLSYNYISLAYGGGKFIVMGNTGIVTFSEDGLDWDASKEQLILTGTNIYDSSNDQQVGNVTPAEVLLEGDAVTGASDTAPGPFPTGVLKSDAAGNVIDLINTVGTWEAGMSVVKDSTVTEFAPSPLDVTFTSMNAGTTPFTGTEATLAFRTWTLETRASAGDAWTVVDTYEDYDPVGSQDGATPWTTNKPTLAANTMYRVKVQYNSANADPVESVYSTFTTGNF